MTNITNETNITTYVPENLIIYPHPECRELCIDSRIFVEILNYTTPGLICSELPLENSQFCCNVTDFPSDSARWDCNISFPYNGFETAPYDWAMLPTSVIDKLDFLYKDKIILAENDKNRYKSYVYILTTLLVLGSLVTIFVVRLRGHIGV